MRAWGLAVALILLVPALASPTVANHDPKTKTLQGTILAGDLARGVGRTTHGAAGVQDVFVGTGERYFVDVAIIRITIHSTDKCPGTQEWTCGDLTAFFDVRSSAGASGVGGLPDAPSATLEVRTSSGQLAYASEPARNGDVHLIVASGTYDVVVAAYAGAAMEFGMSVTAD